ncbi:MAG: hypothetical protein HGB26_07550 [Desulfobulbaceae bacterium]|nr:hypothetical protein [Desulfobulbaceae bacterium]
MSCDFCGSTFDSYQPLQITIQKSGDELLLYAKNQSKNIISTSRMLLCLRYDTSTTVLYLRPDSSYQKLTTREIEQGTMLLQYRIKTTAKSAQAEAEYVEISGRSVSCNYDL